MLWKVESICSIIVKADSQSRILSHNTHTQKIQIADKTETYLTCSI